MESLRDLVALPGMKGLDLDDPALTEKRRAIIQNKPFLRKVYMHFYTELMRHSRGLPSGIQIELGSGAGFFREVNLGVITSEILRISGVDAVMSAQALPFKNESVAAIYMLNVFHHIPDPAGFLAEVSRSLAPGGKLVMIEPCNSIFGRFIYRNLHHEPFDAAAEWELAGTGPLSDANLAAPWIVFNRDRERFIREFPLLRIRKMKPFMPFNYLLSGGVSMRSFIPQFTFPLFRALETLSAPLHRFLGMFTVICLERVRC